MKKLSQIIGLLMSFGCLSASAGPVTSDDFRCEKFRVDATATLKEKLLENCDVTKPYSFAFSGNALGDATTATYCCIKKK